jgi:hypothetical protein
MYRYWQWNFHMLDQADGSVHTSRFKNENSLGE